MNRKELIKKIKNIDNIFKYSIQGGASKFNKEHPNLLKWINIHTEDVLNF